MVSASKGLGVVSVTVFLGLGCCELDYNTSSVFTPKVRSTTNHISKDKHPEKCWLKILSSYAPDMLHLCLTLTTSSENRYGLIPHHNLLL